MNPLLKKLTNCYIFELALLLLLLPAAVCADDAAKPPAQGEETQSSTITETTPPALPEAPPPESDDSRNPPTPEVNIIQRKEMRIEEYSINGRIRYVKIIPKKGKPYYLVDKDGDGRLETRHSDLDGIPPINEWILLKW